MKTIHCLLITLVFMGLIISGCTHSPRTAMPAMSSLDYTVKEPVESITTSLFPSDQAVLSDEAVGRILSSHLELPSKAKLAIMKFPDTGRWGIRNYGQYYWRDEDYVKLQQSQIDVLMQILQASDQVKEVFLLPSLMMPSRLSIPFLREAAVRMQADLLLVFRIRSETYSQYRTFQKDKVKAYSTCEMVLLDVRTGLVPFSKIVSRERLELKESTDLDLSETMRRAEQTSAAEALKAAAEDLVNFTKAIPRKGN